MPEADIDRLYDYSPEYMADILRSVKTIAMVGASGDKTKFSYGVRRVLQQTGYDMAAVNSNLALTENPWNQGLQHAGRRRSPPSTWCRFSAVPKSFLESRKRPSPWGPRCCGVRSASMMTAPPSWPRKRGLRW